MVSSHFTTIQNLMLGCAALEAGLFFTLLNHDPKSREARHLRAAAIGVPSIAILAAILYECGMFH